MIKGILVINNHGKPRLTKFYEHLPVERQQQMIRECFTLISKRSDRVCNFLEDVGAWSKDTKLVYRVYATLYFIFVVDGSESELGILDLIHVFVESLDHVFENVCELDLIFHTDKVHHILDEIVMGGMVLETNLQEILTAVKEQEELETKGSKVASAKLKLKNQLRE
uniref:AP complex subunit sigma n=2 Tax=Geminigeraceae TaxID=589343 RepID=A0A7S0NEJ6_9CRYP|mmetsp:Transcript_8594/g.19411  ORF Transcript_8594/g.19411 Transcript_8594/m.19411 type:complete len:167 (+) Transcript_8594:101-601(+)